MFPAATLPFPSAGDVLPRCLSLRPATFGSGRRVCGWPGYPGCRSFHSLCPGLGSSCPDGAFVSTVFITSAGSNRLNQINPYSTLSPFRKSKTSDFFEVNIRTFDAKHPYFCPKKSDVFKGCSINQLGKSPSLTPGPMSLLSSPRKKFWKNILHFLHPYPRSPVIIGDFG